ncbi:RHS repeat-associated core domain-containing protein [uncultured Bacteroides sp.]|uniref:RHS repeat-associated core domain-containing protein n=1 Tax=uncultured Bacteroides sp. TaxID=162156 RepID=UPI002AAA8EC3|nr:RHS repeat-associated core domain-containing protein [uncultured Bacteroides sp.]
MIFNQSRTVEQTNHYYPFGVTFGEGIDNSDNRYKYNDKELDRMHGLDWYDYGARMQTGMNFTTIDPLAEKYYSISPYAYCADNPMKFVDKEGKYIDIWYPGKNGIPTSFRFDGNNGTQAPNNSYVQAVIKSYNYDVSNGGGDNLKEAATNSNLTINVAPSWSGSNKEDYYSWSENIVHWDTNTALRFGGGKLSISPATILEHEMAHAIAANKDLAGYLKRLGCYVLNYQNAEEQRVMQGPERKIAIKNKEIKPNQQRIDHTAGDLYPVGNSTSTTPNYVGNNINSIIYFFVSQNPNIVVNYK